MKRLCLIVGVLLACSMFPAIHAEAQYQRGSILGPMITPDTMDAVIPGTGVGEDVPTSPGRIHWGRLKILPSLGFSTTYDDNIFLSNGDASDILNGPTVDDWIFQLTPALGLSLPFTRQRGRVAVGYVGDFAFYVDNTDNNWDRQLVTFDFDYQAPKGFSFRVKNGFIDTSDPFGSLQQYDIGVKKRRWSNELEPTVGYQFSRRFRSFLYYTFYNQKYRDLNPDFTQNYRYHEVGPGFEVLVLPKTWAFVRYHYVIKDFYSDSPGTWPVVVNSSNNANNDRHRVNAGLTWDATSKITGELNVGWEWILYKNATAPDGQSSYVNKNLPVVNTALNYEFSPNTLASLYVSREWWESGSDTKEAFASTGVGINASHTFFQKFQARAGFGYQNDDYNIPIDPGTKDRNDNNFTAAASIAYIIQDWLRVGATYNLYVKDSNYDRFDFTDNKGTIWVVAAY